MSRGYLFFEERLPGNAPTAAAGSSETIGGGGDDGRSSGRDGASLSYNATATSASAAGLARDAAFSSDDYGRAFRRALRAGLDPSLSPRGESEAKPS